MESLGGGGAERIMLNLARKFSRLEYQVDLVVASAKGPYRAQVPDSVRLVDLGTTRTITAILPLARYLRSELPDVLLSKMGHCNIVSLLSRKLAGSATRVVISEVSLMGISTKTAAQLRSRLIPFLAKRLYPRADAIIAVSQGVADDLASVLDLPFDKIDVIFDPVVTPELHKRAGRPLEHPWFTKGAPPVIIGVGRLDPEKDFPTLLRAFSMVRGNRNVRLMILGEGPERFVLESLAQELGIADVVTLPGFVENPLPFIANASGPGFDLSLRRFAQCAYRGPCLRNSCCGHRLSRRHHGDPGGGSFRKAGACRRRGEPALPRWRRLWTIRLTGCC